jgi:hypothetical protein
VRALQGQLADAQDVNLRLLRDSARLRLSGSGSPQLGPGGGTWSSVHGSGPHAELTAADLAAPPGLDVADKLAAHAAAKQVAAMGLEEGLGGTLIAAVHNVEQVGEGGGGGVPLQLKTLGEGGKRHLSDQEGGASPMIGAFRPEEEEDAEQREQYAAMMEREQRHSSYGGGAGTGCDSGSAPGSRRTSGQLAHQHSSSSQQQQQRQPSGPLSRRLSSQSQEAQQEEPEQQQQQPAEPMSRQLSSTSTDSPLKSGLASLRSQQGSFTGAAASAAGQASTMPAPAPPAPAAPPPPAAAPGGGVAASGASFAIPSDAVSGFRQLAQQKGLMAAEAAAEALKEVADDWEQPFELSTEEADMFRQLLPMVDVAGVKGLLGTREATTQVRSRRRRRGGGQGLAAEGFVN